MRLIQVGKAAYTALVRVQAQPLPSADDEGSMVASRLPFPYGEGS